MDQQNAELEKRLEKLEKEFSDMRKTLDALVQQTAVKTAPKNEKKPKGKLFLRICIPVLIVCLLTGGFIYYRASQKPSYAKAEIGDIVTFGQYEQNNSETDGLEPIEWIVLDKQDGKILLLSKYILFTSHATDGHLQPWRKSRIKNTLTSDFIPSAFSPQEQNRICTTEIEDEQDTSKVFILSKNEVEVFFPTEESRKALPTATCLSKGSAGKIYFWWTRERDTTNHYYLVTKKGEINVAGDDNYGVRPALWLDISK